MQLKNIFRQCVDYAGIQMHEALSAKYLLAFTNIISTKRRFQPQRDVSVYSQKQGCLFELNIPRALRLIYWQQ